MNKASVLVMIGTVGGYIEGAASREGDRLVWFVGFLVCLWALWQSNKPDRRE